MTHAWEGEIFPKYLQWRISAHGRVVYGIIGQLVERVKPHRSHYSMFALINTARFEWDISSRDEDGFKVANVYSPYMSREFTFSGVVGPGFFELVGGTPQWFIDWSQKPDRLDTTESSFPSAIASRAVLPHPFQAKIVWRCGTPSRDGGPDCQEDLVDVRPGIDPRFASGRCLVHGNRFVRESTVESNQ